MGMMWGFFQALQLIILFSLWQIKVPQNVLVIQASFKSIMGLEMIDKNLLYDKTFGKVIPEQEEYDSE